MGGTLACMRGGLGSRLEHGGQPDQTRLDPMGAAAKGGRGIVPGDWNPYFACSVAGCTAGMPWQQVGRALGHAHMAAELPAVMQTEPAGAGMEILAGQRRQRGGAGPTGSQTCSCRSVRAVTTCAEEGTCELVPPQGRANAAQTIQLRTAVLPGAWPPPTSSLQAPTPCELPQDPGSTPTRPTDVQGWYPLERLRSLPAHH